MIEINLLPEEMRKVDRTSLKRLVCMVAAVIVVSASAIGLVMSLKQYRAEQSRNRDRKAEVARLEPLAREYDVLSAELDAIETRIGTIREIRSTRLRWGRKLDQLYAVLPEYVWFERLELKKSTARTPGAGQGPAATLVLECYAAGANEKRYSEFRRMLNGEVAGEGPYTGEDFFSDFASLDYSGWSREDFPETEEGVALKFKLELDVKPLAPAAPATPKRPVLASQKGKE